jgi:hypothetical protein
MSVRIIHPRRQAIRFDIADISKWPDSAKEIFACPGWHKVLRAFFG